MCSWRNYDGYAEMLRNCDVGLSLMLSPHTSYPPIEMAACGAACVTNVYSVKTQQRLLDVSRNLVPVQPTLEDVVAGLQTAVEMSRDRAARCEHARLSVAPSWDEVFDPLIPKLIEMWNDCRHSSRDMGQAIALPIAG
jgi:hypothetical protein